MVFRLLKRIESPRESPLFESGWTGRLHALGRALDEYGVPLRDLAVATAGYDTWVTVLAYQGGMYRGVWMPLTLRVEDHAAEYMTAEPDRVERPPPVGWPALKPTMPWSRRLRALGLLLDRSPSQLRDLLILDLDGGFVVQGLIQSQSNGHESWVGTTREVTADEIAETARELPVTAKFRIMRLRKLELA
ncbi:MAG: hypothetical protein QOF01_2740 [Thermomicrobiales bacterium]|nr:hypothetical protein [Thermomicrobiales bacterium]MEA2596271.1 hypothetical protein [Thermomicrobiales bacterium]